MPCCSVEDGDITLILGGSHSVALFFTLFISLHIMGSYVTIFLRSYVSNGIMGSYVSICIMGDV